ncbi:MAG TPA: MmgE/PrpD family protein [Stellaceae bacterium]|nr:MmgE/PrpD family protein [Stellaceae bacterium]
MPIRDPAHDLAEHVCRTGFADLPQTTIDAAARDIADTLGCMLGGSGAPGIAIVSDVLGRWGGRAESRVLLHGSRLPAPHAALINAAMGHALDFDDTLDDAGSIHPGVSALAAGLAIADRRGGVSGRDLVLAIALGLDVSCRVALAATTDRGWHRTAAMGVFGAAAVAGKLLGLGAAQMLNAFGIAYSQAAGNRQCILDGALTKRLQAGQAAGAGVFAAILAGEGFTGAHEIFTGRFGFFELYQPGGYDVARLTDALGTSFRGEAISFKPYPCGRPLHAALDAALALHRQLHLTAGDVAEVTLETDAASHAEQFAGGAHKRRPEHVVHAQFGLPFLTAAALTHGRVGIDEVNNIHDPDVLALAAAIRGEAQDGRPKGWARLSVRRKDGNSASLETAAPSGSPERPLGMDQLADKFRDCARHAVRPIAPEIVEQVLSSCLDLTGLTDVAALTRALA